MSQPAYFPEKTKIDVFVEKYMDVLGILRARPVPVIKIRNNLGAIWHGRTLWKSTSPDTTIVELQKSILADERTLERVIAHEMVHHRDLLSMSPATLALMKLGIYPQEHGKSFLEGAARINAVMGANFVHIKSDKEFAASPNEKDFYVLIRTDPIRYAWAARISPQMRDWIKDVTSRHPGTKLVVTKDDRWTRGAKIKRWGGESRPLLPIDQKALQDLYETAEAVTI